MNALSLISVNELANRKLEFKTMGNVTEDGFKVTGTLFNLPEYLRQSGIHPLDHFGCTALVERRGNVSIYSYGNSHTSPYGILRTYIIEVDEGDKVTYYDAQTTEAGKAKLFELGSGEV